MGTAVAKRTATAVRRKPIADVVRQIKTHIYDATTLEGRADKHRLQAGHLLLQLRQRIESGEEGNDLAWWPWCEKHIERSRSDCKRLMEIAAADDPEQALEDERERVRKAVAKNREKTKAELEAARMLVTSKPKADDEPTKPEPTKPSESSGGEPPPEPEPDPIEPENYVSEYLISANAATRMARDCLKIVNEREASVKRRTQKYKDDTGEILDAADAARRAWQEVYNRVMAEKLASTLPQDGRSEVPMDDCTTENEGDDLGDIPAGLDRRRPVLESSGAE